MNIIYLGPSPSAHVFPYPDHVKDETVDYPEDFALDLLESSKRQLFAIDEEAEQAAARKTADEKTAAGSVPDPGGDEIPGEAVIATSPPPETLKVSELKTLLRELEIAIPAKARRDDLIALVNANTAEPPVNGEQ